MGCKNQKEVPTALLRPINMNFHVPSEEDGLLLYSILHKTFTEYLK